MTAAASDDRLICFRARVNLNNDCSQTPHTRERRLWRQTTRKWVVNIQKPNLFRFVAENANKNLLFYTLLLLLLQYFSAALSSNCTLKCLRGCSEVLRALVLARVCVIVVESIFYCAVYKKRCSRVPHSLYYQVSSFVIVRAERCTSSTAIVASGRHSIHTILGSF